jgi:polysaccharide biosynthesis transport protein
MAKADLRTYLRILRRRAGWILLITVIVVVAVLGIDKVRAKQYTATAQLLVQPASTVNNAVVQQTASSDQVLTEMQLLTSTPVKQAVQKVLKISQFAKVPLASTAELGQTNVITVSAKSGTPRGAKTIADAYADAFVAYERTAAIGNQTAAESQLQSQINTLDNQIAGLEKSANSNSARDTSQLATLLGQEDTLKTELTQLQAKTATASNATAEATLSTQINVLSGQISTLQASTTTTSPQLAALLSEDEVLKEELAQLQVNGAISTGIVQLVSPAILPTSPSSPKPLRDGVLAVLLGLVLGIALALLIERFDDDIYTKEDAEAAAGAPVLAMVPLLASWKPKQGPYLVAKREPNSPATEAYRSLHTALQFAAHDEGFTTILVTSPSSAEGKTSTAANLGVVIAGTNKHTVLVDCDLRRPRLAQFLDVGGAVGFTNVLLDDCSLADAVQTVPGVANLFVLSAGTIPHNPAELLGSPRATRLFNRLQETFDVVVIDSPPLLPVTDALILSKTSDVTLLVAASGGTDKGALQRAAELLVQAEARHVGIVLNEVSRRTGYGYGGYGYEYKSAASPTVNGNGADPLQKLRPVSTE